MFQPSLAKWAWDGMALGVDQWQASGAQLSLMAFSDPQKRNLIHVIEKAMPKRLGLVISTHPARDRCERLLTDTACRSLGAQFGA